MELKSGDDVNAHLAGLHLELHLAVGLGVHRVVAAHADIHAGMVGRAALAHDDVADDDLLAARAS